MCILLLSSSSSVDCRSSLHLRRIFFSRHEQYRFVDTHCVCAFSDENEGREETMMSFYMESHTVLLFVLASSSNNDEIDTEPL